MNHKREARLQPGITRADFRWAAALVLVGLFAFGLRWYYVAHAVVYEPIRGDAIQYHAYAWNIAHHGIFSQAPPHSPTVASDSFRDPGYPLFLAIWLRLFASFPIWYPAVLMSQALLGSITVVLLMAGARGWLPDRWLLAAGMLMAVWPHSVTMTSFLLSETLFGFLCALAFYCLGRSFRSGSANWAALAGLGFGAAALTNAVLIPFASLLALALLWRKAATYRVLLALALASVALPATWSIHNMQLPAGDASSTGRAMLNFVQGSWPAYHRAYRLSVVGDPSARLTLQAIQHEYDVMHASPAKGMVLVARRFGSNPLRYLAWYLRKPADLWAWSIRMGQGDIYEYPTLRSPFDNQPALRAMVSICQAINPLLMVLALVGCLLALRRHAAARPFAFATTLLALYVTAVYSLLQSEPRYSIPFRGFEILLAIFAVQGLTAWLTAVRRRAVVSR